jgi:putative ABC transport system permease protein
MIEAIFISFLGGLMGIGIGTLASTIIARFGGWPIMVTTYSVFLSFLFSSAVGLFFGWYPARKAANLNPIEALRYE